MPDARARSERSRAAAALAARAADRAGLAAEPPQALPMMSADRFRWCRAVVGWSGEDLAARLALDPASVRQMAGGRRPVPAELALWLESLAAGMLRYPVPRGWRK